MHDLQEQCQTVFHMDGVFVPIFFKTIYNKTIIRFQGCVLAEPGGPWHATFVLGQLKNLSFLYKSYAGHPRFYRVKALGSLRFSLEHSLGFGFCDIQNNVHCRFL